MNLIRTFIAIHTPAEFRPEISDIQEKLKNTHADIKWEHEDKFHITLKFLGDVKESVMPGMIARLESVLQEYSAFPITYKGLGCFPNKRFPKVVWVGAENTDGTLLNIRERIEDELVSFGFLREKQRFSPHVTIGRVKSERGVSDLISSLEKLTLESKTFRINEILVMKSVLKQSGSEYRVLKTITLQNRETQL